MIEILQAQLPDTAGALSDSTLDSKVLLFLIAGSALGAVGGLFYKLWGPIKEFLWFRLTTIFEVHSGDHSFWQILNWLETQECTTNSWRTRWYTKKGQTKVVLGPGSGHRILKYKGHRIVASMSEENLENSLQTRERLTLRFWGKKKHLIKQILEEAEKISEPDPEKEIELFRAAKHGWDYLGKLTKRFKNTVYLTEEQESVFEDAKNFFNNKEWYIKRGIPYRRGYLFYGKPGTGKSSLVHALASELDSPLYIMSGISSDIEFALGEVPEKAIVLIEDVDATTFTKARDEDNQETNNKVQNATDLTGASLSILLNAIDGIAAGEGRLLIMTTNHPNNLDPALIRPGRCDRAIEFNTPTDSQLEAMRYNILGDMDLDIQQAWEKKKPEFDNVAEAQEFLLELCSPNLSYTKERFRALVNAK